MIRVCKPDGLVGAIEVAWDHVIWYFPGEPRLTDLYRRWARDTAERQYELGADRGIGYKLSGLMRELGLRRIRLDGYPYIHYEADERIPLEYRLKQMKSSLRQYRAYLSEPSSTYARLSQGGMKKEDYKELVELDMTRLRKLVGNPSKMDSDFSMNSGIFFIATGVKRPN